VTPTTAVLQRGPKPQRLFPGTPPRRHRSCQHLGLKDRNWLCFQSPCTPLPIPDRLLAVCCYTTESKI